jgi:hypothetical protein
MPFPLWRVGLAITSSRGRKVGCELASEYPITALCQSIRSPVIDFTIFSARES